MVRFWRSSAPRLLYYTVCSSTAPASPSSSLLGSTFHLRHFSVGNLARAKDSKESVERLRNVGFSGHICFGKTTQTEQERIRTAQIIEEWGIAYGSDDRWMQPPATNYTWKDYMINIIDIPGHVDSTIEVKRALRVVDGAVLVLCGVGGVQSQSITIDRQMRRYEVPRLVFINKLDQMGANPWKVLNQARSKLQHHSAAIQVPMGLEDDFKGLVDLVQLKAYSFYGSNGSVSKTSALIIPVIKSPWQYSSDYSIVVYCSEKVVAEEVPANMEALVLEKRCELIETVSKVDDKLAEAFLGNKPISAAFLEEAVRRATIARKFIPVFMGSAFENERLQPLLDDELGYLPCPIEVSKYVLDKTKNEQGLQLLLDGVLSYLPCPIEVSNYALDQTKNEKVELPGSPDGPLLALAFKLEDCFGQLTCLRIYEGVIRTGGFIINVNAGKKIKVLFLVHMHANAMIYIEEIEEAHAGQIVVVNDLDCAPGDAFTDGSVRYTMTSKKIPEPVMSLAIQPVSKDSGEQVVF